MGNNKIIISNNKTFVFKTIYYLFQELGIKNISFFLNQQILSKYILKFYHNISSKHLSFLTFFKNKFVLLLLIYYSYLIKKNVLNINK